MSKARRSEGPRAPLFYSAAALLLLSAKIATAQTVDLSTLEICAGLETQDLKLACFEAIINTGNLPEEPVPEIAVEGAPENAPVAIEPEPADHSQVAPEVTPAVSVTPSEEDFGREQLATADQEEKKIIEAMVVDVTQGSSKLLYFHLANGQVWRQIEPRRIQYPKSGDFEVGITHGMMGDYRLRIGDNGRMVRIRRVE